MRRFRMWVAGGAVGGALCAAGIPAALVAEETSIEERLARLEEMASRSGGGFLSAKGDWFSLGGEVEFEYIDAQFEPAQDSSASDSPFVHIDKWVLYPKVTLSDDVSMTGEIEFTPTAARVEEWHVTFGGFPWGSWLRVGFDERFSKANGEFDMANRLTEDYPMIGTAWWRDEEYAVTWGGKVSPKDLAWLQSVGWRLTWGDGLELNERQQTENDTYEITHDDDQAADTLKEKNEVGAGLVFGFDPIHETYKFDVAVWSYHSNLNRDEQARLRAITGYTAILEPEAAPSNGAPLVDETQERFGIRSTHVYRGVTVTGEYATAEDGKLDRHGEYLQGAYKFRFDPLWRRYLTSVEPVVRVERYTVENLPRSFSHAETWDREKTTLAALVGVAHGTMLKIEHYDNEERTGGDDDVLTPSDPHNDEWMIQLEVKF
ncbi:MAG: hypothetical protein HY608_09555 [Planctomycetes bacterium]|nr:hypothetical protein [Planctomycetota bacterium]